MSTYHSYGLSINSVETIPQLKSVTAFNASTSKVFKETEELSPAIIDNQLNYMPWGTASNMPYHILDSLSRTRYFSTFIFFPIDMQH